MPSIIWIFVNSNTSREANKIGRQLLTERLIACYSLIPKLENVYYWPAGSGKLERNRGPQLVLETLPRYYSKITKRVRQLHSDQVPFIGKVVIDAVNGDFYRWMKQELR